jgi:AcrR family transcriptional regulator
VAKGITIGAIVDAAFEQLDAAGIDGVTVRAIADRLGVKAPALYWHVRDKQALLDEMGTEIQRRVVARLNDESTGLDAFADWRDGLRRYAGILRAEYLAHRDGARTFSGTRLTDPAVLRAQEPWLAAWAERSAHAIESVVLAGELVTAFVVGFVIEEQERAQSGAARYSLDARDAALGPDAPHVAAAGRVHAADPDARFATQLDVILDGLALRLGD